MATDQQLLRRIQRLWNRGLVQWDDHAIGRGDERTFDLIDVEHVIRYGRIVRVGTLRGRWQHVEMVGTTKDGQWAKVPMEVNGHIKLVTVIREGRRHRKHRRKE